MSRIIVIGAGLAGLATAIFLAKNGRKVTVYEATGQAGGRCRSFFDRRLNSRIDNGNHLMLSGNCAAMEYLSIIGSKGELIGPESAKFPFIDLSTKQRWVLQPNSGRIPWWVLNSSSRVPNTKPLDYLSALNFLFSGRNGTIADSVGIQHVLFERLWEPLAIAVLNTPVQNGSAKIFWSMLRESFASGGKACCPRIAKHGLSETFINPAIAFLKERDVDLHLGHRLEKIDYEGGKASRLFFGEVVERVAPRDKVILAVPPVAAVAIMPTLTVPSNSCAIVNAHFHVPGASDMLEVETPFIGLIGGTAQWLFVRGDIASITVSAADQLANEPVELIARKCWNDVASLLGCFPDPIPAYRILKEKRATFEQTPQSIGKRAKTQSSFPNIYMAGDWTDTGLPATIEGAIRSGFMAAKTIINSG